MITAPNTHVNDRSSLDAMIADWTAEHGAPRRFPRGFSGEWFAIRNTMLELGYDVMMNAGAYTIKRAGEKCRPKRMGRERILAEIDRILAAHGREPFIRRNAA